MPRVRLTKDSVFPGNSARSANWMRTLEFAIWERAQTSSLRRQLYSSPDAVPVAGRFDSAAVGCAASKLPARRSPVPSRLRFYSAKVMTTFFRGNSTRSANWMITLEFAIWERAQTSSLRRHCSHLLTHGRALRFSCGRLRGQQITGAHCCSPCG